jgi:hypothetical protein
MQHLIMVAKSPENWLTPDWLAHRYDPGQDAVHFLRVDRDRRARAAFLTDDNLGKGDPVVLQRRDLPSMTETSSVRYIFHSAYCCSTLLANAYDRPGLCFSLKEPVILNDIVGWRHRGARPEQLGQILAATLPLLARPFQRGEHCIIKPSNVVNGLIPALLGGNRDAKALLLYAPLRVYLGSIASKGLWGRLWVRDLLAKQLKEGFVDLGFGPQDYFLQSDLQVAAVGWLAQHALFARLAASMPERVRTLDSEVLVAGPVEALTSLDAFFDVKDGDAGRQRIIDRVFSQNAKSGEQFASGQRGADQDAARLAHADEIDKVAVWAEEVAARQGLSTTLAAPLI